MKLDRVTITGADDGVSPDRLAAVSERYPFVEWGILQSWSREGTPRYPSAEWVSRLKDVAARHPLNLSAHLCGGIVRDLIEMGKLSWADGRLWLPGLFQRIQLNFDASKTVLAEGAFREMAKLDKSFIFQIGKNGNWIYELARRCDLAALPLFDCSGGRGELPGEWPDPVTMYCGYAGGLSPDNLEEQLRKIYSVARGRFAWIDMESGVRTGERFDLEKVTACLEIAKSWVK